MKPYRPQPNLSVSQLLFSARCEFQSASARKYCGRGLGLCPINKTLADSIEIETISFFQREREAAAG